jgi:hypothetical protein
MVIWIQERENMEMIISMVIWIQELEFEYYIKIWAQIII